MVIYISYSVGSCHDGRSEQLEYEITAGTTEDAINQAREIVKSEHERSCHLTDYHLKAGLYVLDPEDGMNGDLVWKTHFVDRQPAQPARRRQIIPAQKATPEAPAHLSEQRL